MMYCDITVSVFIFFVWGKWSDFLYQLQNIKYACRIGKYKCPGGDILVRLPEYMTNRQGENHIMFIIRYDSFCLMSE